MITTNVRGAYQCEIDPGSGRQLTETRFLWAGTGGSFPEAPRLFRRGDYYYLLVAEGGTAEGHMVTVARSRNPYGPFKSCPHNPILTHRSLMAPFQGTGHADFVEDAYGNWWAVFLRFRYCEYGWHNLGRETFLAPVDWTPDEWPVVNGESGSAHVLATGETRYLSTQVGGGYSGVIVGVYATGGGARSANAAEFAWFEMNLQRQA